MKFSMTGQEWVSDCCLMPTHIRLKKWKYLELVLYKVDPILTWPKIESLV
jgi:hypothetical protein